MRLDSANSISPRVINGKCAHRSALLTLIIADFIHGVEESPVGMNREKRRIGGFCDQANRSEMLADESKR